jgi:hypothetical protein
MVKVWIGVEEADSRSVSRGTLTPDPRRCRVVFILQPKTMSHWTSSGVLVGFLMFDIQVRP